jgi:hypothetical protein
VCHFQPLINGVIKGKGAGCIFSPVISIVCRAGRSELDSQDRSDRLPQPVAAGWQAPADDVPYAPDHV